MTDEEHIRHSSHISGNACRVAAICFFAGGILVAGLMYVFSFL